MDRLDRTILRLLEENGRISWQELGDRLGISRQAAGKRVAKLEAAGIIRGYHAEICRENEVTLILDVFAKPGCFETVRAYLEGLGRPLRQLCATTKKNHLHLVAVSDSVGELRDLLLMIQNDCGPWLDRLYSHAVTEVIRDAHGGVGDEENRRKNTEHCRGEQS